MTAELATKQTEAAAFRVAAEDEMAQDVRIVVSYYQVFLGRLPDADGLDFWVDVFRQDNGFGTDAIAREFSALVDGNGEKTEFADRYDGATLSEVVRQFYAQNLGRDPLEPDPVTGEPADEAGYRFWLDFAVERMTGLMEEGASAAEARQTALAELGIEFTIAPETQGVVFRDLVTTLLVCAGVEGDHVFDPSKSLFDLADKTGGDGTGDAADREPDPVDADAGADAPDDDEADRGDGSGDESDDGGARDDDDGGSGGGTSGSGGSGTAGGGEDPGTGSGSGSGSDGAGTPADAPVVGQSSLVEVIAGADLAFGGDRGIAEIVLAGTTGTTLATLLVGADGKRGDGIGLLDELDPGADPGGPGLLHAVFGADGALGGGDGILDRLIAGSGGDEAVLDALIGVDGRLGGSDGVLDFLLRVSVDVGAANALLELMLGADLAVGIGTGLLDTPSGGSDAPGEDVLGGAGDALGEVEESVDDVLDAVDDIVDDALDPIVDVIDFGDDGDEHDDGGDDDGVTEPVEDLLGGDDDDGTGVVDALDELLDDVTDDGGLLDTLL